MDTMSRMVVASFWTVVVCLTSACATDYVYIQRGKSETQITKDYSDCAEQQQLHFSSAGSEGHRVVVTQKMPSTSDCMESKGYRTVKIEPASHPDRSGGPNPSSSAFLPETR